MTTPGLEELVAAATAADGVAPLSEAPLLGQGGGTPLTVHEGGVLVGYAYAAGGSAEVVVHPDARRRGIGTGLVAQLEGSAIWAHGRLPAAVALAERLGWREERVLWQLRRPLTDPIPDAPLPAGIRIRSFTPADEQPWLRVNARAFAAHPEQGAMTLEDLRAREAEPWFDPAGFLLAVRADDSLAGFHWTKVHDEKLGEVYVLGVDPDARGLKLGPALAVAGLHHLRDRGLETVLLYVDDDNPRAVRLYESMGFTRHAVDVQFVRR